MIILVYLTIMEMNLYVKMKETIQFGQMLVIYLFLLSVREKIKVKSKIYAISSNEQLVLMNPSD